MHAYIQYIHPPIYPISHTFINLSISDCLSNQLSFLPLRIVIKFQIYLIRQWLKFFRLVWTLRFQTDYEQVPGITLLRRASSDALLQRPPPFTPPPVIQENPSDNEDGWQREEGEQRGTGNRKVISILVEALQRDAWRSSKDVVSFSEILNIGTWRVERGVNRRRRSVFPDAFHSVGRFGWEFYQRINSRRVLSGE